MSDLKAFTLTVAEHLPGWEFDAAYWEEYQHVARLVNPGIPGAKVYMQCSRGRAEISGGYPEGFHPSSEQRVTITVNMERDVAAVARDIERRFLGLYLDSFYAAVEAAYRMVQAQARARDVADELAAIMGCSARHDRETSSIWSNHGTFRITCGSDGPYISVERLYSISIEMAKEIARIFARSNHG